ncbi:UNVERIFIED_CONTAM: hypothetical protein K7Z70_19400 [Mycobacterium avium subsp. hominissuis]
MVVFGAAGRAYCLQYVEQNLSDIRPKGRIEALAGEKPHPRNALRGRSVVVT